MKLVKLSALDQSGNICLVDNYAMLSFYKSNRAVVTAHVEKLKKSLTEFGQKVPIQADQYGRIWDGQHRYTALKELGLPIQVIFTTMTQAEFISNIVTSNLNNRKFNFYDSLKLYCDEDFDDYINLRTLMDHLEITPSFAFMLYSINPDIFSKGEMVLNRNKKIFNEEHIIKELTKYNPIVKSRHFWMGFRGILKLDGFDYKEEKKLIISGLKRLAKNDNALSDKPVKAINKKSAFEAVFVEIMTNTKQKIKSRNRAKKLLLQLSEAREDKRFKNNKL